MSAPLLKPKEEEEEEEEEEEKMSAPLLQLPKEEETSEETSATCQRTLTNSRRTLAEVTFAGAHRISTTVTRSDAVVAGRIGETIRRCSGHHGAAGPRQRHVVGLEVACQPNGSVALLQLRAGSRCLIYQLLLHSDSYSDSGSDDDCYPAGCGLFSFFRGDRFCFVAAGTDEVVRRLRREPGFLVRNAADLGGMAAARLGREDLRHAGLERLARKVMGLKMGAALAEVQMSEWRRRRLSRQQIACTSVHAFVSFELGRILFGI